MIRRHALFAVSLLNVLCWISPITANDWPMWRHDSERSGRTAESLADNLKLAWSVQLPPADPAYKDVRLRFDAGPEPIVIGKAVIVASNRYDCVSAYDLNGGGLRWRFFTNGPVRCAPAGHGGNVIFGSDDGTVYCLDAATGKLRWTRRVAPTNRTVLGNRRLISMWPVRGGPVVKDDTVYVTSGVWSFEGVFVFALNARDGSVIWRNDELSFVYGDQPHNTKALGGLTPQGYLAINDDELIVPNSNAYPARINRLTGKVVEFKLPAAGRLPGGWFATVDRETARQARRGVITIDSLVNRNRHEDRQREHGEHEGLSRRIHAGDTAISFDDPPVKVPGEVHAMAVAYGRLIVALRDGRLMCFAPASTKTTPTHHEGPSPKLTVQAAGDPLPSMPKDRFGYALMITGDRPPTTLINQFVAKTSYQTTIVTAATHAAIAKIHSRWWSNDPNTPVVSIRSQPDPTKLDLPPYVFSMVVVDSDADPLRFTDQLRPYGGMMYVRKSNYSVGRLKAITKQVNASDLSLVDHGDWLLIHRPGKLAGSSDYAGDWRAAMDERVKAPLGILWFDDTVGNFKRAPQPVIRDGVMITYNKDWTDASTRQRQVDYRLLKPVFSDIYTGRPLDPQESQVLAKNEPRVDPTKIEPSQYRPSDPPTYGTRTNPATGEVEPRAIVKQYGCDKGFDYGHVFTMRSATAAFYDKRTESGTVYVPGPRSGCTNSIIPAGGLLNVPYFYEGCSCSYPMPVGFALQPLPEDQEQWADWGSPIKTNIRRIGINLGAPGDRMTHAGMLWMKPSDHVDLSIEPASAKSFYQHSGWLDVPSDTGWPWVFASGMEGVQRIRLRGVRPGSYRVDLYFHEYDSTIKQSMRVQQISIQGVSVEDRLDIRNDAAGSSFAARSYSEIKVDGELLIELKGIKGQTLISGFKIDRIDSAK